MGYSELKHLIDTNQASILFVGGTNRSGSTITQVVFSYLVDRSIHQPFIHSLHLKNSQLNLEIDKIDPRSEAFEMGCDLIVSHILEILKQKERAVVLVKEVSAFFTEQLWDKWLQIPDQFVFILRDPHLQYFSWLALVTDLFFEGRGSLLKEREFIFKNCQSIENATLENLQPAWKGTTLTYNKLQWDNLVKQIQKTRLTISNTSKEMAIFDLVLLQKDPDYVMTKTLSRLGFHDSAKDLLAPDSITQSQDKVIDIRGTDRPSIQKARGSHSLEPLKRGKDVSADLFSQASQEHILRLIPLYLDLLYAPENVGMLSLAHLEQPVANNAAVKLEDTNPFVAYAVAKFNERLNINPAETPLKNSNRPADLLSQRILETQAKILNHEIPQLGSFDLTRSFEEVDRYLNSVPSFVG